jgi:hypothetical protein
MGMNKSMLLAVLAGLASALMLLAIVLVPGGVLFGFLVPLPLFMAGLSLGFGAAVVAGVAASVVLGFMGGLPAAAGILATFAAPVAILVRQALLNRPAPDGDIEWYPPGLLATWLSGIGVAMVAISALALSGGEGIEASVHAEAVRTLTQFVPDASEEMLFESARFVSFFSLVSWLLLLALNGMLAQGVVSRFGWNLRPAPDIADTVVPNWLPIALAAAALAAVFGTGDLAFIATILVLILTLPFFFAGLGLVHALCRRIKARRVALTIFYMFLVLFSWPAVLVAGLGLLDHWADIRGRLRARGGEQEED